MKNNTLHYFFVIEFLHIIASYQFFKKWLDFHKSCFIFSGITFSITPLFLILKVKFSVAEIVKWIFQKDTFKKKLTIFEYILFILKIEKSRDVKNIFPEKYAMIYENPIIF